jgi:hypothetical protein
LGLCIASTTYAATDDDDDEWHDTKGPRSERHHDDDSDSDESSSKSSDEAKKSDDTDKKSEASSSDADADAERSGEAGTNKKHRKPKAKASSRPGNVALALLGSYGFPDSMRPGLGVRGGVRVDSALPLYFGGIAQYFFGSGTSRKDVGDRIENTRNFMFFGGEAGLDVEVATDVVLRPMIGLGLGLHHYKHCSSREDRCTSDNSMHPVISPGIVGLYSIGDFFFGVDFRYLIVPGRSEASGPAISLTAGLKF